MFEFGINGADYGTHKTNWLQDWPEKTQIYWESRGTLAERARNFFSRYNHSSVQKPNSTCEYVSHEMI